MVLPQYLLPQHLLSRLVHRLTRCRRRWLKNLLIGRFIAVYNVDMGEAAASTPDSSESFNAFFTRALTPGARPVDSAPQSLVSPADAEVSQAGEIRGGTIFQAKGHAFTVAALLDDAAHAAQWTQGRFATLYLAPRDYHRVHMPLAGTLESIDYVPGRLFSVNAVTTDHVPGLFARNERIVCRFRTEVGPLILCMVGALFVGSMDTLSHGPITPARVRRPVRLDVPPPGAPRTFAKGAEFGRFNMGSTVILLLPERAVEWDGALVAGAKVKMGQRIGTIKR